MRSRVTGYSQGKYLYTLSDKSILMMYKDYTISKEKDIVLAAWVYFYLTIRNKKNEKRKRKAYQKGGWLNRYDFAYAGRDADNTGVNGFNRIASGLMNKPSTEVDLVAKKRIKQFIQKGGKKVERVAPIIFKNLIGEIHKTHLRLLGNFGKRKYLQMKKNVNEFLKRKK